mgnify:CR=1 FL=1
MRGRDCGIGKTMFLLAYYIGKILLSDQYYKVIYPLKGFEDYLKGPAWLNQQDMERLHQQMILFTKQKAKSLLFYSSWKCFFKKCSFINKQT